MVTDTAMVVKNGKVYAFGPVVRELVVFQKLFSSVEWIGFNRQDLLNDPVLLPVPEEVRCILLSPAGGDRFLNKLEVLVQMPVMLWHIFRSIRGKQVVHTRAPSSPAFLAALLSIFFPYKIWWHKYAGNWGEMHPPFFFGLQRHLLSLARWSRVTINGRWPGQPAHCLSFENPCLDEEERRQGAAALAKKDFEGPLQLCFVGHLNEAKGMDKLLEALPQLPADRIAALHLIGDGPLRVQCENVARQSSFPVYLHGYLSRAKVARIMAACHLLVLPSRSEGFPKVVAEAANYGCVPVVSDVSAIGQYIRHGENGFLLAPERLLKGLLAEDLKEALYHGFLKEIAGNAYGMAKSFTFEAYCRKLGEQVLR